MSHTDTSDVQVLQHGGDDQQREVFERWSKDPKFVRHLRNLIKRSNSRDPEADLIDLRQTTLIGFWRHIITGQFRSECGLRTLLCSIARNRWGEMQRKQRVFVPFEPDILLSIKEEPEVYFPSSEQEALLRLILEAWRSKADRCVDIFQRRLATHAFEAIEENLGLSPGSGRKRYYDCLERLRKWLLRHPNFFQQLKDLR